MGTGPAFFLSLLFARESKIKEEKGPVYDLEIEKRGIKPRLFVIKSGNPIK
jgi:hypothetical protein